MLVILAINSYPKTISEKDFDVQVTITGAKPATNYLRIELYKEGSTDYVGETFNGKSWYSGTDGVSYFPVTIEGTTSATIKGRINKDIKEGDYKLKIKRYTASGSSASDTVEPVDVKVILATTTPTPTPTPVPTIKPQPISQISPSPQISLQPTALVLSKTLEPTQVPTNKEIPKEEPFPLVPAIIFAIGLFCIGISIYPFVLKKFNRYNKKNVPCS